MEAFREARTMMTSIARHPVALAVSALIVMGYVGAAHAFDTDRDYYAASQDREVVLKMVYRHHLWPGRKRMEDGEFNRALGDFEFIFNYFPNDPLTLLSVSELCSKWKSPKCNVEEKFARAIDKNPMAGDTYVLYGIYLHRNRKLREAIDAYERGVELNPKSMNGHYNLALAYLEAKEYQLANKHAQISYSLGASLPGLREKLKRLGYWEPRAAASTAGSTSAPSHDVAAPAPSPPAN
jgi:tetratricopeptide (TPR) repeat protein